MPDFEILPTGAWTDTDERNHKFDYGLCMALKGFFSEIPEPKRIIDLGCGPGRYVQELALLHHFVRGFDGNPNLKFVDQEHCFCYDMTTHLDLCFKSHWIVCLEVGEHIPQEYEEAIWRHFREACDGVILSWAVPGQNGQGHVNCRSAEYVGTRMEAMGFTEAAGSYFRNAAVISYFKKNVRIFLRPDNTYSVDIIKNL